MSDKIKNAIEARYPGETVTQMTDLQGLDSDVVDELVSAISNAGPPITHPDELKKL
jgi:hypothetical protein